MLISYFCGTKLWTYLQSFLHQQLCKTPTCEGGHVFVCFNLERAMPQVPRREVEVLGEGATSLLLLPVQGEGIPWLQQSLKGNGWRRGNAGWRERRLAQATRVQCDERLLKQILSGVAASQWINDATERGIQMCRSSSLDLEHKIDTKEASNSKCCSKCSSESFYTLIWFS